MIAVDIMGGDFAPKAPLRGALAVARKKIPLFLFGPKEVLVQHLNAEDADWADLPISIMDAPDVIGMQEDPLRVIRKKRHSSLVEAMVSVGKGKCSAVVSAGNSGALLAAAIFFLGRSKGVRRPAIAGFLPARKQDIFCLDLGANVNCKSAHLVGFAELGIAYLSRAKGIAHPTVGLLSNGSEPSKGSSAVKKAYSMLRKRADMTFVGNVEPADVVNNFADIVVCDGFAGNILLKSFETVGSYLCDLFSQELARRSEKDGQDFLAQVRSRVDWTKRGGALLLGVNGTVVVAHGRSDETAMENAIMFAWQAAKKQGIITSISSHEQQVVQKNIQVV